MDAVLINPAVDPEEVKRIMAEYEALLEKAARAGIKIGKKPSLPVPFVPTSQEEMMQLINAAYADPNASIIAFFPANSQGQRVVKRAIELDAAPDRSHVYFTIQRSGVSKPTKTSPGGVARNFGVAVKLATEEDASRLNTATGSSLKAGDLIASGYNVEARSGSGNTESLTP
jgi:hypothetical protein